MSWTFCMSGAFPVGFPTVLTSFPDAVVPSSTVRGQPLFCSKAVLEFC